MQTSPTSSQVARPSGWKCFFVSWIFAWVVAIYAPSAALAFTSPSLPEHAGFLATTFAIADEVAPAAKLAFGVLTATFWLAARRFGSSRRSAAFALQMALALLAMLLTLGLLPQDWSRGFGIGLTSERFAPAATLIYVVAALLSGFVFAVSHARCSAREMAAFQK